MEYQVFYATEKHQTAKGILLEGVFAGVLQEQWFPKAAIKPMGKSKWLARPEFVLKHSIQVLDEVFEPEVSASNVYWDISDRTAITDTRGNYEHQTTALHVMSRVTRGALFMEMGTGKTRIALHLAKYRYKDGAIQAVLYLCPLSVCYHIQGQAVVHGTDDVPMCLLGIESFSNGMAAHEAVKSFMEAYPKFMLIIDEIHLLKNCDTKRSEAIARISAKATYCLGMTGTPITQSPADLYGIFNAISPNTPLMGYSSYRKFEQHHLVKGGYNRKQIVGYHNLDPLTKFIQPWTYQVTKSQCLQLPPKTYQSRCVELSDSAKSEYNRTKSECLQAYEESKNENIILSMFTSLQKLATYDNQAKLEEVLNIYREQPSRLIVWCKYTREIENLVDYLSAQNIPCNAYYGLQTTTERTNSLAEWKSNPNAVLVANMAVGGIGIDLTECDRVVYYSNSFKYSERLQSEDRCHRIGQTNPVSYITLLADCGIDKIIAGVIERKANLADAIRTMIEQNLNLQKLI